MDEMLHVLLGVGGGGRDAQPLLASGNRGIVDRLDVAAVLREQQLIRAPGQDDRECDSPIL